MGCSRRLALLLLVALALHALVGVGVGVDARYLPTRAQDDRLERLRELIRDLLENEVDKYNSNAPADLFGPDRSGFVFKQRQVPLPGRVMLAEEERK